MMLYRFALPALLVLSACVTSEPNGAGQDFSILQPYQATHSVARGVAPAGYPAVGYAPPVANIRPVAYGMSAPSYGDEDLVDAMTRAVRSCAALGGALRHESQSVASCTHSAANGQPVTDYYSTVSR